ERRRRAGRRVTDRQPGGAGDGAADQYGPDYGSDVGHGAEPRAAHPFGPVLPGWLLLSGRAGGPMYGKAIGRNVPSGRIVPSLILSPLSSGTLSVVTAPLVSRLNSMSITSSRIRRPLGKPLASLGLVVKAVLVLKVRMSGSRKLASPAASAWVR